MLEPQKRNFLFIAFYPLSLSQVYSGHMLRESYECFSFASGMTSLYHANFC